MNFGVSPFFLLTFLLCQHQHLKCQNRDTAREKNMALHKQNKKQNEFENKQTIDPSMAGTIVFSFHLSVLNGIFEFVSQSLFAYRME